MGISKKQRRPEYVLKLFVSGSSPNSIKAIGNIQKILDTYLEGKYSLSIIDLHQEKEMAQQEQIIALPLLIRKLPLPEKRLIGDMSETKKVLAGLGIITDP